MADPFAADHIQVVVEDGNRPVPAQPVALPAQPVPVAHGGQQEVDIVRGVPPSVS